MNIISVFKNSRLAKSFLILSILFSLSLITVNAVSVVIYNGGAGWTQWGSPSNWSNIAGGSSGTQAQWTLNTYSTSSENARWSSTIYATCSADVWIPGANNGTRNARYFFRTGSSVYLVQNLDQYANLYWTYMMIPQTCNTPAWYLNDATYESANTTSVLYDELRINY